MPRGGARVGAGRKKGGGASSPAPQKDADARHQARQKDYETLPAGGFEELEPLAYMLRVMNDPTVDANRRDRIAVAAAPYVHAKIGEGGKKEKKQDRAEEIGKGRFAVASAPRLVARND